MRVRGLKASEVKHAQHPEFPLALCFKISKEGELLWREDTQQTQCEKGMRKMTEGIKNARQCQKIKPFSLSQWICKQGGYDVRK